MLSVPGSSGPARCPLVRHAPILPVLLALAATGPALAASAETAARPQGAAPEPPQRAVQSAEDRGFAIVLVSPTEPWLNGRQPIRIEAIIPRDDTVEQVDFFVDRKLVFVDTDPPYAHTFDFGEEIRRHTIEVKALTREGRRARVSFVSRTVDLAENAPGRVVTLTAMVRDTAGRPIDRLEVSDFRVTEAGVPQPIVHFLAGPSPTSLAVVVDEPAWNPAHAGLENFLKTLPGQQAVALLGAPGFRPFPEPPEAEAPETVPGGEKVAAKAAAAVGKETPVTAHRVDSPFTYDLVALRASIPREETPPEPAEPAAETAAVTKRTRTVPPPPSLPDRLGQAATALASRRGPRLLLVVAAVAPVGEEPFGPLRPPDPVPPPKPAPPVTENEAETPPVDPLSAALEEARRTGAVVHVIALPAPDAMPWPQARAIARTMRTAVDASGGAWDEAGDAAALERAFASVSERLRHQYVVSYLSGAAAPAGWKDLEVGIRGRDGAVEAPRSIYLAE